MPDAHPQKVTVSRFPSYNAAHPVRKQDPVSPAHALFQRAMWPKVYLLLMLLYRNPGATKRGICDLMEWPLWQVRNQFTKMYKCGLLTRRNVGSRVHRYYLTREAFLIARTAVVLEEVLGAAPRPFDGEE